MATFNILDFGARGDGQSNDANAIQQAIDACHATGGGTVLVPAGRSYLSGTIMLKSHIELHVERGASIVGSGKWDDYTYKTNVGALSGGSVDAERPASSMLIMAEEAEHIAITGGGEINGSGRLFIEEETAYIYRMCEERPFTIFLIGCHNVTVRDVTIRDGALWTLRLSGCQDVLIHGIRILNDLKLPNNDGIDLDRCRNVRISDCHIVTGDDCICLKACEETFRFGPCENITVTGCTLMSTSSALIIGAECCSPIRNVIFDACVVQSSHRGLAIHLSEFSVVENVLFSNMVVETRIFHEQWWGRGEPIYVVAMPWTDQHDIGRVRHVRFRNVLCRSENGVFVYGWTPDQIEDVVFEDVRVEVDKWSKWPSGQHDLRPCPGEGLRAHPTAGFFLQNARHVTLRNCEVAWGHHCPERFRYALESHQVADLVTEHFKGTAAFPEQYPASLID
ncbi:MAG: hypothetical protein GFH25_541186n180 [Chloroflexi bacterium AL-N10]|nr:hypothetical protein [Chloroflexi bacterium AL-N1]NOK66494.1 hypothetical protein [Chloroflexi bacterium AL-N10]NOK71882.1 hypothetical protein [Chloroflexi bacterium AL-N5]NOK89412.1 hypothetical protein [Chloroflexi bacterium AL-N15]